MEMYDFLAVAQIKKKPLPTAGAFLKTFGESLKINGITCGDEHAPVLNFIGENGDVDDFGEAMAVAYVHVEFADRQFGCKACPPDEGEIGAVDVVERHFCVNDGNVDDEFGLGTDAIAEQVADGSAAEQVGLHFFAAAEAHFGHEGQFEVVGVVEHFDARGDGEVFVDGDVEILRDAEALASVHQLALQGEHVAKFHLGHGAEIRGEQVFNAQFVGERSHHRYVIDAHFGAYINLGICRQSKKKKGKRKGKQLNEAFHGFQFWCD